MIGRVYRVEYLQSSAWVLFFDFVLGLDVVQTHKRYSLFMYGDPAVNWTRVELVANGLERSGSLAADIIRDAYHSAQARLVELDQEPALQNDPQFARFLPGAGEDWQDSNWRNQREIQRAELYESLSFTTHAC